MAHFHSDTVNEAVSSAQYFNDCLPFLKLISTEKLKQFIHQNLNETTAKTFYYNSLSIDEIMPTDIIQHILSFQCLEELNWTKIVNKQWKKLSNRNEKMRYLKLQESLDKKLPDPYKSTNRVIIVHPFRTQLTSIEKKLGFSGPINNMPSAINMLKSGDRLYFHDGTYEFEDCHFNDFEVNALAIGLGHNVVIRDPSPGIRHDYLFQVVDKSSVYIENITFDCTESRECYDGAIYIEEDGSNLWLNNCEFTFGGTGMYVRRGSSLKVENCVFDGAKTAIAVSAIANTVTIEQSIFKHCGIEDDLANSGENGCIQIDHNWTDVEYGESELTDGRSFVKLTCIGNTFEDNLCYPISERAQIDDIGAPSVNPVYIGKDDLYRLEENIISGYNGKNVKRPIDIEDANTIYYNDEEFMS